MAPFSARRALGRKRLATAPLILLAASLVSSIFLAVPSTSSAFPRWIPIARDKEPAWPGDIHNDERVNGVSVAPRAAPADAAIDVPSGAQAQETSAPAAPGCTGSLRAGEIPVWRFVAGALWLELTR